MTASGTSPQACNIILLTFDALRADHLSCHGYHRATSPNISRFAEKGTQFTRAYSPSSHTREAVPALLSGRYPSDVLDGGYNLSSETVAAPLQAEHYRTAAFHSNPFLSRAYGYDTGFDKFYDSLAIGGHKVTALLERFLDKLRDRHYVRAQSINKRSIEWLGSLPDEQSFFLWNHYMDVHGPYEPPKSYQREFRNTPVDQQTARDLYKKAINAPEAINDDDHQRLIDLYDAEIRYLDDQLGAFLDQLSDLGISDDTLIILTADHGDAFGEQGYYEHPRQLHDGLIHVPLIGSHADLPNDRITIPTSTLDIVPSIGDVTPVAFDAGPGESLFEVATSPDTYANRVVFSIATGEDSDAFSRQFGARSAEDAATIIYRNDQEIMSQRGPSELISKLRCFSDEHRQVNEQSESEGTHSHGAVSDRLEALGYRE